MLQATLVAVGPRRGPRGGSAAGCRGRLGGVEDEASKKKGRFYYQSGAALPWATAPSGNGGLSGAHMMTHFIFFFFLGFFIESTTHRIASSKTPLRPCCVSAEHSMYL